MSDTSGLGPSNAPASVRSPSEPAPAALPILYVDDEAGNLELFCLHCEGDFDVRTAANAHEALAIMKREDIGLLLTDERMPGMSGIELLEKVSEQWPDTVRVIVSAYSDADRLWRAINKGHAHEYVVKPWADGEMRACIERGLEIARRRRSLAAKLSETAEFAEMLEKDRRRAYDLDQIVGAQGGLAAALAAARKAAASDATVLLRGETGTGKELFARFIHENSGRAQRPFISLNCAAVAEGVLESELFGHERGAFTSAVKQRRGRFELANRGTIFLDEIGDISPKLQASLLRVLQERVIERVGGDKPIPVDVRVIAATHRDLDKMISAEDPGGRPAFRGDLFYRLNVVPIFVPPLRDRPQDVRSLVGHFVAKYRPAGRHPTVTPEAMAALTQYYWPGNVRELENLVQRALIMSGENDELHVDDFSLRLEAPRAPSLLREQVRANESEKLQAAYLRHGGNWSSAARELGVPRSTLMSRAKKYGLL